MRLKIVIIIIISAILCSPGWADEIQFSNGDKLTGEIVNYADGKLTFNANLVGQVVINIDNLSLITTDSPVTIVFMDGGTSFQNLYVDATPPAEIIDFQEFSSVDQMILMVSHLNPPPPPEPEPQPKPDWTGNITGGANMASGNTKSEAINLGFDLTHKADKDRFSTKGSYNYGRQRDSNSDQMKPNRDNWSLQAKYDHFYDTKCFYYWSSRLEKDKIKNLDQRIILGLGFGHQFIDNPMLRFSLEGGAAWMQEKYIDKENSEDWNIKVGYSLMKKLNNTVSFTHNTEYLPKFDDFNDFLLSSDLGIRTNLMRNMFANFTVQMKYESETADYIDNTDFLYSLGLGFKIN